jgi:hypothetical protein
MSESSRIEALEHQLMRAWASGDTKQLKGLLARRFRLVVGASSPVLLDYKSLVDAAAGRWSLTAFRFGSALYAREQDGVGIFAAEVELQGRVDGQQFSGSWWMSDVWRKSTLTRRWQLLDRQLGRLDPGQEFPAAVRALQLWR